MFLFIAPNNFELTSYNELKYKQEQYVTFSSTVLISKFNEGEDDMLRNLKDIHLYVSNIQTTEDQIQNSVSWNEIEMNNFDVFINLHVKKTINVKARIKSVSHYVPKIIID